MGDTRMSKEEVNGLLKAKGMIALHEYKNRSTKLLVRTCEGYLTFVRIGNLKNGQGVSIFERDNPHIIHNIKKWLIVNSRTITLLQNEYTNPHEPMLFLCQKCNTEFKSSWSNVSHGKDCPACAVDRRAKARTKDSADFEHEVFRAVGNEYTVLDKYTKGNKKLKVRHNACGYEYKITPGKFLQGSRCPKCSGNIRDKDTAYFISEVEELVGDEYEVQGDYLGSHKKVKILHTLCGRTYKVAPTHFLTGKRCPLCYRENNFGEAHPSWKPDKTDEERELQRCYPEYTQFIKDVYERDDYTCTVCAVKGGQLNAHHLNGYHWHRQGRTNVNNAVTLCNLCHEDFHKVYGRKENTKEQFEEYLLSHKKTTLAM